ncbi:MAG: protein kinase [Candidatus Levybacteria bacterium]|nr:protein kinase [Candidatus Levybacteria bacterium]
MSESQEAAGVAPSAGKTVHKNAPPGSSADTIIRAQTIRNRQREELRAALADKVVKRNQEESAGTPAHEFRRDDRETVVNAFNSAFSLLEQTPEDQLSQEEIWAKQGIKAAKEKTIDQGKDTFTNSFANLETGKTFTQEEGIPIEELLEFLRKKAEGLAPDSSDKKELIRLAHVLYRNSQPFTRLPHRMEPARLLGRVRQEAYFVSKDIRATGSDFDNWLKGEKTLMARLELTLPPQKAKPPAPEPEEQPTEEARPGVAPPRPTAAPAPEPAAEPAATGEVPAPAAEPEAPQSEANLAAVEPQPATLEQVVRDFTIVNQTIDIEKRARELAEQQLREEMRRGSGWNPLNWPRKIGLRLAEDYYRQLYTERARQAMLSNNNSYLAMDVIRNAAIAATHGAAEQQAARKAKIEDIKTGEQLEGQQIVEVQGELKNAILSEILRPIIDGQTTTEAQVQQKLREFVQSHQNDPQVQAVFGRDVSLYGRLAEYFATDLLEMGNLVKKDIDSHKYAIEQLGEVAKIRIANASWAAETQASFNRWSDRAVRWAQQGRIRGAILNPATIGAIASATTFLALRAPGGIARTVAPFAAPGVGILAGAAFAAARRNYDLKVDRASHQVERTYNMHVPQQGAPRREALERYSYNTASVGELINGGGQELLTGTTRKSLAELSSTDLSDGQVTNRANVIRRIAEIKARLDFSSREKVDLVTFAGQYQVEQGRLALTKAVGEARQALKTAGISDAEISQLETNFTGEWNSKFTQNREQQDRSFAHYRLRNALGAGAFGGAAGLAGGIVGQEALAQVARHFPEAASIPVIGGLFQKGETAVERTLRGIGAEVPGVPSGPTVETFRNLHQSGGSVDVNDLRLAVDKTNHSVSFFDRAGSPLPNAPTTTIDAEGNLYTAGDLPDQIRDPLQKAEFKIYQGPDRVETITLLDPKDGPAFQEVSGHKTVIPKGTEWVPDPTDKTKWDLRIQGHPARILVNDAQFDASGKITYDHKTSMDPILKVSSEPDTAWFPRTSEQAVAEWDNLGRKIHHREWYAYNLPGSQENELRLHTLKDGTAVTLDMSTMKQGVQTGLSPNPIDVVEVIRNKQAGFAFSLPGHEGKPVWVPEGADGVWDGKLRLDPNDTDPTHFVEVDGKKIPLGQFSKMVLDQDALKPLPDGDIATEVYNRREVFRLGLDGKMGTIEAGTMADRKEGKVLQAFATIFGKGEVQVEAPPSFIANVELLQRLDQTELVPTHQIIPPPEFEAPPIIPIPFAPRHPLEPLVSPIVSYIYNERLSEEQKKLFEQRRSPALKNNPKAILDQYKEAQDYFTRQKPEYVEEIKSLAKQINQPPSPNLKAIVAIPVAAHQEGENIYNTLKTYAYQDAPTDEFEILLFLNYPEKDRQGNPIKPDKTLLEVERFKKDYPDLPVRVITKILPLEQANIGTIRKYLSDVALYRHLQRGEKVGDLILISNDADQKGVAPTYISNFLKRFEQNKEVDGLLGQLDWDPEAYVKYPLIHVGTRLFQYLNTIGRFRTGRMPSSGANFAFRGSAYSAVGGYLDNIPGGEDIALGQAIIQGRRNHSSIGYAGARTSRLYTSARRAINALSKSLSPVEQWNRGFSVFDDEIRKFQQGVGEDIDYNNPQHLARLKSGLEEIINRTLDVYEEGESLGKGAAYYRQALRYLGVKYELKDDQVAITNMDVLVRGLKHYKKIGALLRDIKAGKGTAESRRELKRLQDEFYAGITGKETELLADVGNLDNEVIAGLEEFNEKTAVSLPSLPAPAYTLEELKTSANTLGSGQMGDIVAGYDKETGEVLAFKRVRKEEQQFIAKANNYPEGVLDLEDIIKNETNNRTLGVYRDKIDTNDETIKVYSLARIDLDLYLGSERKLRTEDALAVTIKIAETLRDLHRIGIVHLDLSPTNILLDDGGVRIVDFNAASIQSGPRNEYKRGFVGGFRWITPPELFEENPTITEDADTYEASILLYKLITGKYPYHYKSGEIGEQRTETLKQAHLAGQFEIPDSVPVSIRAILRRGIQPDPAQRYQTANELLRDLLNAYNKEVSEISQTTAPTSASPAETLEKTITTEGETEEEQKRLKERLREKRSEFDKLFDKNVAFVSNPYTTLPHMLWQEVIYGPKRIKNGDNCFRGYLMVEPENMDLVLIGLRKLAEKRQKEGKRTDFKWLLASDKEVSKTGTRIDNLIGSYPELKPTDGRIVIYGDALDEVKEILAGIATDPWWQEVEQHRVAKFGGLPENAPRRPGTNSFVDASGKEWRTLNYNDKPGYSEDEAADPDWRAKKAGTKTKMVT